MGELWASYGGQLWRAMLIAAGGRRDLADDVTAEAFARLLAHYDAVREPQAWLYRTGYRLLMDEYRRQRRLGERPAEQAVAAAAELDPELVGALATLAPNARLCVFLHYYADMPISEIARLTGTTKTTVRVRLHRARTQLRVMLSDAGSVHA